MSEPQAMEEFKAGLYWLFNNYARKALPHFRKAVELGKTNPFYLSYLGLSLAAADQRWDDAEEMCLSALRMKRTQAEFYLNLAQVYRLAGKRADAVETLNAGLPLTKRDERLSAALRKFGLRRSPVLPFLERTNFLNRELGKLRQRVMKPIETGIEKGSRGVIAPTVAL